MSRRRSLRRVAISVVAFSVGLVVADRMMTSRLIADAAPATQPATQPAAKMPLAADVQAIIDRVDAAYAKRPLQMTGELVTDIDVAGMKDARTINFDSTIRADDTFRHEAKDSVLVVANPAAMAVYDPQSKQYMSTTRPSGENAHWNYGDAASPAGQAINILAEQNPALNIAIVGNARQVMEGADLPGGKPATLSVVAPQTEDGRSFDRIDSEHNGISARLWIDHEKGTLARVEYDFAKMLEAQSATEVKSAKATVHYTSTKTDGVATDDTLFAFVPPAGATEAHPPAPAEMMADADATALEGKPAPSFSLKDLDGKETTLDAAKGKVVVLDFWATWCPPCRAGLPHIAAIAKKHADGVAVFAMNQQEDADTVRKFLDEQKLQLVALLDVDGVAGKAYSVSGIPQTVVIGRDGKVRKVVVGFSEELGKSVDDAVEAALAEGK